MIKPSDHNAWQEEGSRSDLFSEVVERFNPFTSSEEKAAYFQGVANRPKKREPKSSGSQSGAGGGGGDYLGGLLGGTWILWVIPAVMLAVVLLTLFPAIWLVWRVFRKKPDPADNDFVGTGWTILGAFLALLGMSTIGTWAFLNAFNWSASWREIRQFVTIVPHMSIGTGIGWVLLGIISISLPLSALIGGIDLLRKNRAVVSLVIVIALSVAFGVNYYHKLSPSWNDALTNAQSLENVNYPFIETMRSKALGLPFGIRWGAQGAEFSAARASRIEYPSAIPPEGTIEFRVNVKSGYHYDNFKILRNLNEAMIFSTDAQGGDVTWPGAMKIFVRSNGDVVLNMAVAKYDQPPSIPTIAHHSTLRFNGWHMVGVSYGTRGQYIMVDGKLAALAPSRAQTLGAAGDHLGPRDVPTIGETVSHFWAHHRYEGGFEGTLGEIRVSKVQLDWSLAKEAR